MKNDQLVALQKEICQRYSTEYCEAEGAQKLGISLNVKDGVVPINGVRINERGDTCGWYIWGGEVLSEDDDFFKPLHVEHLNEWRPEVMKYLGLPPGWRFLVADNYEDVWFDPSVLVEGAGPQRRS
jgi:hypothetical protein